MNGPIGIYEHRAHLFAGLPQRDPCFAELDRLIAEAGSKLGRPVGRLNRKLKCNCGRCASCRERERLRRKRGIA